MKLRKPQKRHFQEIEQLVDEAYSTEIYMPHRRNLKADFVIEGDQRTVAYGMARGIYELFMAIDPKISKFQKAKIVKLFVERAIEELKDEDVIHISTLDEEYAKMLCKHYSFHFDPSFHLIRRIK